MVAIEYEAMHKLLQMPTDNALRKSYFGHYGNELPWNGVISWRQHKQTNIYNAKDNPPLHFGITHSKLSLGVKKLQTTFNAARSTVELRSYFFATIEDTTGQREKDSIILRVGVLALLVYAKQQIIYFCRDSLVFLSCPALLYISEI